MIEIQLVTIAHVPPFSEVTLRTDLDNWAATDIAGSYGPDRWVFRLNDPKYLAGFKAKFVLNRKAWALGDNLNFPGTDGLVHTIYLNELKEDRRWGFQTPERPVVELGSVQTKIFDVSRTSDRVFDVIVIGSGMAGGVLADRLSDNGIETLLLEAGGVPLETHIANLPRPQYPGTFTKHVWERWPEYQVLNYDRPADNTPNDYGGAQAFNLGGRSVFWGGFIPRMSSWELDFWPTRVKSDLEDKYYQIAEDVMGRSTAPYTHYTRQVHRFLRETFPQYSHFDAPVAVRTNPAGANTITTGMFSTADLLLESARTAGQVGSEHLTIYTHQEVVRIDPGNPCSVVTRELTSNQRRTLRAKYVVIAAGCLESARLAKRSNIGNANVGVGVTDHPIAFRHFKIPPTSPYYDRFGTVKVVSQPREAHNAPGIREPFNILIELGADFNQGRFIDEDILIQASAKREMLCEIVFLVNQELVLTNRLDFDAAREYRPVAKIRNAGIQAGTLARINAITQNVMTAFGGEIINSGDGNGGLGGVAHEVGSLRMSVQSNSRIDAGLQQRLDGVVDDDGKFLNEQFVFACGNAIFPTSPAANPSLTTVALAMRLADHLTALVNP